MVRIKINPINNIFKLIFVYYTRDSLIEMTFLGLLTVWEGQKAPST